MKQHQDQWPLMSKLAAQIKRDPKLTPQQRERQLAEVDKRRRALSHRWELRGKPKKKVN